MWYSVHSFTGGRVKCAIVFIHLQVEECSSVDSARTSCAKTINLSIKLCVKDSKPRAINVSCCGNGCGGNGVGVVVALEERMV